MVGKVKNVSTKNPADEQKQPDDSPISPTKPNNNDPLISQAVIKDVAERTAQKAKEVFNPDLKFLDTKLTSNIPRIKIPESKYIAQENDTLSKIAEKYKLSIDQLKCGILLKDETQLTIPKNSVTVQENDTLSKIAAKCKLSVEALRNENLDVLDNLLLQDGETLNIPDPEAGRYKVQENDKWRDIALKHGISFEELKKSNPDAKDPLQAGTTLKIPKPKIGQMVSRKNVLSQLIANPVGSLYRHPIIHSLSKPDELPDRIPTKDFTIALLDLLDDAGKSKGKNLKTKSICNPS